jgi:hypothetical protein
MEAEAAQGGLPFVPDLLDRLDGVAVCSDGTVVEAGARFRISGPGGGWGLDVEVVSVDQLARKAVVREAGAGAGEPCRAVPLNSLSTWENRGR